jgi:hypothetical protein
MDIGEINTRYDTRLALCDGLSEALPLVHPDATDDPFTRRIAPYFLPENHNRTVPGEVLASRAERAPHYLARLVREGLLRADAVAQVLTEAGFQRRESPAPPRLRRNQPALFALADLAVSA